jgi:hypothetical protein
VHQRSDGAASRGPCLPTPVLSRPEPSPGRPVATVATASFATVPCTCDVVSDGAHATNSSIVGRLPHCPAPPPRRGAEQADVTRRASSPSPAPVDGWASYASCSSVRGPGNGGGSDLNRPGDTLIGQGGPSRGVGLDRDAGTGQRPGRGIAGGVSLPVGRPFVIRQCHPVLLCGQPFGSAGENRSDGTAQEQLTPNAVRFPNWMIISACALSDGLPARPASGPQ